MRGWDRKLPEIERRGSSYQNSINGEYLMREKNISDTKL